jgi:hypothetical protein
LSLNLFVTGSSDLHVFFHFFFDRMIVEGKYKLLSLEERGQIVAMLLHSLQEDGSFPHGDLRKISELFGVDRKTVWRLWKRADAARSSGKID